MYVLAPRRTTNGRTAVPNTVGARFSVGGPIGGVRYSTFAEALANALVFDNTLPSLESSTERWLMQSGVIGYKMYKNTSYWALYIQASTSGHVISVKREVDSPYRYVPESFPIGINYTGGGGYGVLFPTLDANPRGVGIRPEAVYNRLVVSNLVNRAIAECKNKVHEQDFDFSEYLAGIDKTVDMVARTTMQVLYAWRNVRNGNYRAAAKLLGINRKHLNFKSASTAWLEFQYGWRPLMNDIIGGMAAVNRALEEAPATVTAVRRVHESLWLRDPWPASSDASGWKDLSVSGGAKATVEVKFRGKISDANLAYLNSLMLLNPLYTAWIATPFTFVVDWFIPIGDWLSSLTAPIGLKFVDGYATTRVWGEQRASSKRKGISGPTLYSLQYQDGIAEASLRMAYINREAFATWPITRPYFRFPFSNPERIASAIALTMTTSNLKTR